MTADPTEPFLDAIRDSRLLDGAQAAELTEWARVAQPDPNGLAREVLNRNWLTAFQIREIYKGRGASLHLGPYVLSDLLGEGGMGRVFKARHTRLGREVALKVIRKEKLSKPNVLQRFLQEIRAVAHLSHPNVVLALDADQSEDTPYYAMEFVEGQDLTRLVQQSGPIPFPQACEYIRQAALGLQHAFERGLVHRDVKPSNLLVTLRGQVKVLDLGLAMLKEAPGGSDGARVTQDGLVIGTPDFLAPEQAQNPTGVDIRADVYGLGASLFYILTGRVPFDGETPTDKLLKHITEPPPSAMAIVPEIPPPLDHLLRSMMAKKPEERPPTPAHVAYALAPFCPPPPSTQSGTQLPLLPGLVHPHQPPTGYPAQPPAYPPLAGFAPPYPAYPPGSAPPGLQPTAVGLLYPEPAPPGYPATPPPGYPPPGGYQPVYPYPNPAPFLPVAPVPTSTDQTLFLGKDPQEPPPTRFRQKKSAKGWVLPLILFLMVSGVGIAATGGLVFLFKDQILEDPGPLPDELSNPLGMKLILIPAGSFVMGSPEDETGHEMNEGPQATVNISEPFYIASTEVTRNQFARLTGRSNSKNKARDTTTTPEDSVTWDEAVEFCKKLTVKDQNRRPGWAYRLPTEAEWEYACRAGTTTPFTFGNRFTHLTDVVCKLVPDDPYADPDETRPESERNYVLVPYPAGSSRANNFGLSEMHGNLWEWCSDYYADLPSGPRTDPSGPESGDWRALRGGAWNEESVRCRSAARKGLDPQVRDKGIGFRVVFAPVK